MGVQEIALLQVASQIMQGLQVFCKSAASVTTNKTGKIAYQVGAQVASNLSDMIDAGITAAEAEFATQQIQEKAWVTAADAVPPIT